MPSESSPTVGDMLRAAREQQEISINEIAERTRIRSTLIREIENDNFSGCGGTFYARGHVRSIAVTLGLDPATVLAQFDAAQELWSREMATQSLPVYDPNLPVYEPALSRGPHRPPPPAPASPPPPARATDSPPPAATPKKTPRRKKSRPSWITPMLAAVTVVALLALASFLIGYAQGPPQPNTGAKVPSFTPSPVPDPTGTVASPTPPADAVRVQVKATAGSSWIRVTNGSGGEVFQGVLEEGDVKDFSDPKLLTIRFGNAGAVVVLVNGVDKGTPSCGAAVCEETYKLAEGGG